MNRLTVCIFTENHRQNLPRLLASLDGIADEILVSDSGVSDSDSMPTIASQFAAKLIPLDSRDPASQRNHMASLASHHWILALASNEELSEELRLSLRKWKDLAPEADVYQMARLTWYLGAWIHHSHFYPNWQHRLYLRTKAGFCGPIHPTLHFSGKARILSGDVLHFAASTFAEHEATLERDTSAIANHLFAGGQRRWRAALWLGTPWTWFRYFFLGAGFLDGYRGAVLSQMAARSVRLQSSKLGALVKAEKQYRSRGEP
jgi:hypothetical protein